MKRDIQGMDSDLEDYHRKNKMLQQDINSLQSKQKGLQDELGTQKKKLQAGTVFTRKVAQDLNEL